MRWQSARVLRSWYPPIVLAWGLMSSVALRADEVRTVRSLAEPAGPPLFVSAGVAGRADGSMDWQLLGSKAERIFQSVAEAPKLPAPAIRPGEPSLLGAPDPYYSRPLADCLYYAPGSLENPGRAPEQTLRSAASGARGIFQGRVVSVTEGFFGGDIGSLIDLEVEETIKTFAEVKSSRTLRLYYPAASFRAGSTSFCKFDPGFPPRPEIGDDLLVFVRRPPLDEERRILLPELDGVFIQKLDGKLSLPSSIQKDPSVVALKGMSSLTASVAAYFAGSPGEKR